MDEKERLEEEYLQYSVALRTNGYSDALASALMEVESELRELGGDPDAIARDAEMIAKHLRLNTACS